MHAPLQLEALGVDIWVFCGLAREVSVFGAKNPRVLWAPGQHIHLQRLTKHLYFFSGHLAN